MDWSQIIVDLEGSGLTQVEIARLAECSQPLVSELKSGRRGHRLDYAIGAKLHAMWHERCPPKKRKVAA